MNPTDPRLVHGNIPYGAEYWFTSATTPSEMLADFTQMHQMGMNTIRIFTSTCEISPDQYDYTQLDTLFAAAQSAGMTVCPTFSLSLPPWRDAAIHLDPTLGVPLPYLLDDPAYRAQLQPGLQALVARYAAHPALWSWILWNEPSRRATYPAPPPTWSAFRAWLADHYAGDISKLQATWYPEGGTLPFNSFAEIAPQHFLPEWSGLWQAIDPDGGYCARVPPFILAEASRSFSSAAKGWNSFAILKDWVSFNTSALTSSIQWLSQLVRTVDPLHPTHINPDGFFQNQAAVSRDLTALAASVGIFGSSLHPGHHFAYIQAPPQFPAALSYYTASISAAARGSFGMITELQAGPNTWSGNQNFTPDSNDLVLWSLTALGSGLKGLIYWLWKPRTHGWEAGEWGLVHGDGKPTPRAGGATKIGQFLAQHGAWLAGLSPRKSALAILRSPESEALGWIESLYSAQPVDQYQVLSEYGCFRALWRSGFNADLLSPAEIETGALQGVRCLFIPFGEALREETARAIQNFILEGGWVYAEAPFAMKSPDGTAYPAWPGLGLDRIFPCVLDNWPADKAPFLEPMFGLLQSECFVQPLESGGHDVLAELPDGYDVIAERAVGKGRILYCGTCLTLSSARRLKTPSEDAFLADFAARSGVQPWANDLYAHDLSVFSLEGDQVDAQIVINFSNDECEFDITLPRRYKTVSGLLGPAEGHLYRQNLHVILPPRSGEIFRLEY